LPISFPAKSFQKKYVPFVAGTEAAAFVYDGNNMVLAFNGTGALTDRYLWGPAVDQILADEGFTPTTSGEMPTASGTTYWAITDNQGTVHDLVNYAALVDHLVFDAFGNLSSGGPFTFQHEGTYYDEYTGLEYHSDPSTGIAGRWYNPSIQRWMSPDPAGLTFDSNAYRYCDNSPTNYVDPSGLVVGNPSLHLRPGFNPTFSQKLGEAGKGFAIGLGAGVVIIGGIDILGPVAAIGGGEIIGGGAATTTVVTTVTTVEEELQVLPPDPPVRPPVEFPPGDELLDPPFGTGGKGPVPPLWRPPSGPPINPN
jgi:RHS repeat-associated protein